MLHHRFRLATLCIVVALGFAVSVGAGERKRARRQAATFVSQSNQNQVAGTLTICPIYPYANHGSYCSWYAIPCDGMTPLDPVSYDAACDAGPKTPCSGCVPGFARDGLAKGVSLSKNYCSGFDYKLGFPIGISAGASVQVSLPGTLAPVWVTFTNRVLKDRNVRFKMPGSEEIVHAQLLSIRISPDTSAIPASSAALKEKLVPITSNVGQQILAQPDELEIPPDAVTPIENCPRIVLVKQGDEIHTVVLQKQAS